MTTLTHLVSKKAIEQDNIQRYPGPRSFDDKEIDEHLFYGRNKEIDTLINRIQARRTLVLFGLSGVGKTSLIQAGLYPKLRRLGYLPIPIRLNDPNVNLLQSIEYRVKQLNAQNKVDVEIGKYPSVWHLFKQTVFLKNEQLLIPILVFDQFEEVFTLQNTSYRTSLTEELKNLIGRTIPSSVRKDIEDDKHLDYTPEPPEMRLLFILRQEYVGSLETFITKIPTFLEYRFQLKPLKKEQAILAITKPAEIESNDSLYRFTTKTFKFDNATLNLILKWSNIKLEEYKGENRIDTFQLQLVCQHIESLVAKDQLSHQNQQIIIERTHKLNKCC